MKTIAEGVETEAQLKQLSVSGCQEIQGYFISRPIATQAIAEFIATNRINTLSKGGDNA